MKKKKLLIFHPALAPYRVDQFNSLSEIFDLHIIFIFDNVWNHKFDQSKLLSQLTFPYSFLLKGPNLKGRVLRFGMLKKIKEIKPEIIIGYEYSFSTLYLILLKKLGLIDQKLGSTIDDSIQICHNVQSKFRNWARKFSVHNLDLLVVLSENVADFYIEKFHLKSNQVIVSPILQKPDRLRENSDTLVKIAFAYQNKYGIQDKKVLLFVGRFIPEKGLPNLIEIVAPILKENESLKMILVGDGDDRGKLQDLIRHYALEGSIILPGRFEGLELLAWYLCGSGFILPSFYEPFGAVINEALIFGLKIFCSKNVGSSLLLVPTEDIVFNPEDLIESQLKLKKFIQMIPFNNKAELNANRMHINYDTVFENWKNLTDENI